jgi:hypothetical protein
MKVGVRALGIGLATLLSGVSFAGTISDPVISITASSSLGEGTLNIPFIPGNYNPDTDTYVWSLPESVDILADNEMVIATIEQLSTFIMVDPVINVGFVLTAGAANTSVSISSATLTFAAIPNAIAQASAQMGVTDTDGDGASITGGFGGLGYQSSTNLGIHATLVPSFAVGMFGSDNRNGNQGPGPAGGAVSSMSSEFDFTVSANDAASGTSVFVVTPEPASLSLLLLGTLSALRRRS